MVKTSRFLSVACTHNLHSTPPETTMNAATCCPPAITLWTPPHRRLAEALADVFWSAAAIVQGVVRQRRRAAAEAIDLASLDDRTRRDLGLTEGGWPEAPRDDPLHGWHGLRG
jgi:hypothetical protein